MENHYRGWASARGYYRNSAYTSLKPLIGPRLAISGG
jgi:hypothetical protein